jgi:serine/threonine protein kinase
MYIGEHKYKEKFNYEMCAPEMLPQESFLTDAKRNYGHQVDMWTLGCIAFNLACGFPPFER